MSSMDFYGDMQQERGTAVVEQRSSVKISTNAKGDPQIEIKAYSSDLDRLEETRLVAQREYFALKEAVGA